ncbi:MAG: hypothetical protein WC607_00170 [Candidatus Micrarchaeia archaeon]
MKNNAFVFALLALFAFSASASSLGFAGPSTRSGCQCDPQEFTLNLQNDAAHGEVFTLTIEANYLTFTTFVTPTIDAQPHSANAVIAFMTPHCDAVPGTYAFTVRAVGSRGTVLVASGSSTIQECHYLLLHFTPEQSVCSGEEARFDVTLENAGFFPEAGSLFTDLDPSLYSLANSGFDLGAGESRQFQLYVDTPNNMPPQALPFKLNASSFYTYRESVAVLNVLDCSHLNVAMPEPCIEVNPGEDITEYFTLTNLGISDSFDVQLACPSFVTTTQDEVTLASGADITLPLRIQPEQAHLNQQFSCAVRAVSQRYGKVFTNSTSICVSKLYDVEVDSQIAGNALSICEGDSATLPFTIQNKGKAASYALSTTVGSLSTSSVNLAVNEQESFSVSVPGTLAVGDYDVRVTASNEFETESETVSLTVEKCYDAGLSLASGSLEICPGETLPVAATLQNKGTKADDYTVELQGVPSNFQITASPNSLSIPALSSAGFTLSVAALWNADYGTQESVTVLARDGSTASAALGIEVLEHGVCHNILVTPDSLKEVEVCQGNTFDLLVTNRGRFSETLDLSVEGPNWAFVTPATLTLAPGESQHAYVFFSPPFSTAPGTYDLTFHAGNERVSGSASLQAKVYAVGGLGHQTPNYTTQDYLLEFAVPVNAEFEEGASRTLSFTLMNNGIAPLNNIVIFVENDDLRILNASVAPISLIPGESRVVSLEVEPVRPAGSYATMFRAVAREKFVERAETISVSGRSVLVEFERQDYYLDGNVTMTAVRLLLTNNGTAPVTLSPSAQAGAFDVESFELAPGERREIALRLSSPSEANSTVWTRINAGEYAYLDSFVLAPAPAGYTGLFAGALSWVALAFAVVVGFALYYFVLRKPSTAPRKPRRRVKRKR